jgi:hypothetical protein
MKSCFPFAAAMLLTLATGALLGAAPANDNFNSPTTLTTTNAVVTGTNLDATKEVGEPSHAGNSGGPSVWWKWTAPASGSAVIRTTHSSFDTLLAVYTASSVAQLSDSLVASNDDVGNDKHLGSDLTSVLAFNVTDGVTYRIVVDGYNGASGTVQVALSYRPGALPNPPPNDKFATRIPLHALNVTTTGTSYFASKEPQEPDHADELGGASVWWSWTAPVSGEVVSDTLGSNFDTLLAVYQGSVLSNLVSVASNDDVSTNQPTSSVTFSAKGGATYQVAVDGYAGAPGDIQLNVAMPKVVWLDPPQPSGSGLSKIRVTGAVGKRYTLEFSAAFTQWEPVATLLNSSGTVEFTHRHTTLNGFYRALQLPP